MHARTAALGVALLALVRAGDVGAVTIAEVVATPEPYAETSLTLVGTVDTVLPVGSESGYDLRDGAAKITVISRGGAPTVGARLSVTGTLRVFEEGDDRESNRFPPFLVESSRQSAP
jgi:hypothetical protein